MSTVLVVDDDSSVRFILSEFLIDKGFDPIEAHNGDTAIEIFRKAGPALVLLDLWMPGMDGLECMGEIKKIDPEAAIIIVTAHGDVPTAVLATKLGAYDFILKPPDFDRLLVTMRRAIEKRDLENALRASFETLFGRSRAMRNIVEQVRQVAPTDLSVMLQGETGTGKSFIARAIHDFSRRTDGPFINVDMGTIPDNLVESELFGYERGAFTGADRKKKGFFEMAHGGTVVIDELQNVSPYVQGKLLRVVEERKLFPLGSTKGVEVDTRIISASNTDIMRAVKEKKIREDLFFRLGEFIIILPPLRERTEDIPGLTQKFFREAVEELNGDVKVISEEAVGYLSAHSWPGNVRELKNVIRRAVLLARGDRVKKEDIHLHHGHIGFEKEGAGAALLRETQNEAEEKAIRQALDLAEGNRTKAARTLGISHSSLLRKIKKHGIR